MVFRPIGSACHLSFNFHIGKIYKMLKIFVRLDFYNLTPQLKLVKLQGTNNKDNDRKATRGFGYEHSIDFLNKSTT
jgi:hypothetical protein